MSARGPIAAAGAALALVTGPGAAAQTPPAGQPVNREAPVVTQSGTTLTTSDGTWVGATRPFTYEWLRCADASPASCLVVPGETRATYTITGLDAGARLRSRVTGSNPAGSSTAVSAPTAAVPAPPGPAPAPGAPGRRVVPRLSPFPVLVVTGRTNGARTRITGLLVRGPAGARVTVSCRGACRARPFTRRIGRSRRLRLTKGQLVYRSGAVIELRITGRGKIGKYVRLRIRTARAPTRLDRCLAPDATAPTRCG